MNFLILILFFFSSFAYSNPSNTKVNAWLEIDTQVFEKNISALISMLGEGGPKICAVMKADAYGHSIKLLTPSIIKFNLPCVAITNNKEAKTLRDVGFKNMILRIRTPTLGEINDGLKYQIVEAIGNLSLATSASNLAIKLNETIPFQLVINSGGMSRNGLEIKTEVGKSEALKIIGLPHLKITGIWTHYAVEDASFVRKALNTFLEESGWIIKNAKLDRKSLLLHTANSFATLEVPEARLDMVRPGGALYGDTIPSYKMFEKILTFKSRVASVNFYPAGNTVSYDRTYTLSRDSFLANIPVGYSNGYRRSSSNKGFVLIRGKKYTQIGRVTMNSIMVDVTQSPEIRAGDEVVLFGKQGDSEITQEDIESYTESMFAELYTVWGNSNPRIIKPSN